MCSGVCEAVEERTRGRSSSSVGEVDAWGVGVEVRSRGVRKQR